jgi:hypothetical protein
MNKLWTFGCSFTYGDGTLEHDLYYQKYKSGENDLSWNRLLSKRIKYDLQNKGLPGVSNDTIIDTIMKNWEVISKDDVVIIGKTWSHRFDFPKENNSSELKSIVYRGGEKDVQKWFDDVTIGLFTNEQIETIKMFSVEFATQRAYSVRHDFRLNFLKERLIKDRGVKICYIWDVESLWEKFELIVNATEGEIVNHHWSFKGHKDFCTHIENEIKINREIL